MTLKLTADLDRLVDHAQRFTEESEDAYLRSVTDAARLRCLQRCLYAVRLLARAPQTLQSLAAEMDCSPRNARRYLSALRASGVDVYAIETEDRHRTKTYTLDRAAWIGLLDMPLD